MNRALWLSLALVAAPALAADTGVPESGVPESAAPKAPTQNINAGINTTAPAMLPSTYLGGRAQTYPAAGNQPPSRGGTTGDNAELRDTAPDGSPRLRDHRVRERANGEPGRLTHTSTPLDQNLSPTAPTVDANPGAYEGGPQP